MWSSPKPLQRPWPPIHVGVAGKTGTAHAAEWGDAWLPIDVGLKDFGGTLEKFHAMLREQGRDPASVPVSIVTMADPTLDQLKRYQELGIVRVLINDGGRGPDATLRLMDTYAAMVPAIA